MGCVGWTTIVGVRLYTRREIKREIERGMVPGLHRAREERRNKSKRERKAFYPARERWTASERARFRTTTDDMAVFIISPPLPLVLALFYVVLLHDCHATRILRPAPTSHVTHILRPAPTSYVTHIHRPAPTYRFDLSGLVHL